MYRVSRKNGKLPKHLSGKTFRNYNEARQAVRKWLTTQWQAGRVSKAFVDLVNRTFTIGYYGFSISAVK